MMEERGGRLLRQENKRAERTSSFGAFERRSFIDTITESIESIAGIDKISVRSPQNVL